MFNEINISNEYLLFILAFYTIAIVINYLKSNIITLLTDRLFLAFLALLTFVNNKIVFSQVFLVLIILCLGIIIIYLTIFFIYKKAGKTLILNFSKLSGLIESVFVLFVLFVLFFGITNLMVVNILFFAMVDIFYKVIILSITLHLKKKFNIQ